MFVASASFALAFEVGVAAAVLSAVATNLAFLCKHRGAVAAPDVDMAHPVRSAADLFRSKWWTIGWLIAVGGFLAHVAALALLPISVGQAVIAGGFVLLAILAERFFGFNLGKKQWAGVILVAVALTTLAVTSTTGGDSADYTPVTLILFQGGAVAIGLCLLFTDRVPRIKSYYPVLLGASAGLGFGISDVAIKVVSGGDGLGPLGIINPWAGLALAAGIFSFYASARSLQIGEGVSVIAITSVAANMSAILAGIIVFGDPMGEDALEVASRSAAFLMILAASGLMPAPVRVADSVGADESTGSAGGATPAPT
ncbi:MAG: hypothetical protein ACR2NA_08075 [Solirubrobacterales bacterium]